MAIILPSGRPVIDILGGRYERPEEPWSHLGDPKTKVLLEAAIAAVGRVDYVGHPSITWGGTAFVAGPNLLMTQSLSAVLRKDGDTYRFNDGQRAVVDFVHERRSTASLRVEIEEVVYVDPVWKVELVRAAVPGTIKPLALSTRDLDELEGLQVVLIGYPGYDYRNEPSLVRRLFNATFDIKRMMPGRALGRGTYSGRGDVLEHDCTSTAGCGGAPLVDIRTGHVIGVHFAGMYLKANQAVPTADLSADPRFAEAGVRFIGEPRTRPRRAEQLPPSDLAAKELSEAASRSRSPVSGLQPFALEFVVPSQGVETAERPAILAQGWQGALTGEWAALLKPHSQRLDLALRAVGRLVTDPGNDKWAGTAFLVGDRLAMTASFAASDFVAGAGAHAALKPGTRPAIDFSDALGLPARTEMSAITSVRFVHPYFHVALVGVERMPEGAAPLDLASQVPSNLAGRAVAMLSFALPDDDALQTVYLGGASRLYLQPGKALQIGQIPGWPSVPALVHDCTTTVGSAGGPILDLGTGYVIGIHTHRHQSGGGLGQPTWELARDPHVWEHPIGLWPNPRPSWLSDWKAAVSRPSAPAVLQPAPRSRWRVTDGPINWSEKEPRELEQLLVSAIDAQLALYFAENVGLPLGIVNSNAMPQLLWRDILKKASIAGVLARLIEELAAAPQHAGIADKLRAYL